MKIEEFKQKYLDKDCVILTCGPSLKEYPKEKICNFIKDKINFLAPDKETASPTPWQRKPNWN